MSGIGKGLVTDPEYDLDLIKVWGTAERSTTNLNKRDMTAGQLVRVLRTHFKNHLCQ